jgi:hypothetical protein
MSSGGDYSDDEFDPASPERTSASPNVEEPPEDADDTSEPHVDAEAVDATDDTDNTEPTELAVDDCGDAEDGSPAEAVASAPAEEAPASPPNDDVVEETRNEDDGGNVDTAPGSNEVPDQPAATTVDAEDGATSDDEPQDGVLVETAAADDVPCDEEQGDDPLTLATRDHSRRTSQLPPMPQARQRQQQQLESAMAHLVVQPGWAHVQPIDTMVAVRAEDFPYDARGDPFLKRYRQRKKEVKREWSEKRGRGVTHLKQGKGGDGDEEEEEHFPMPSSAAESPKHSPERAESLPLSLSTSQKRNSPRSWNVSNLALNTTPVSTADFRTLKTIFCPSASFACTLKVSNVNLGWLRPVMEGGVAGADAVALVEKRAVKNLLTMNFNAVENDGLAYTKSLINSPRSAILLVRNGVQCDALLKRPPKFYIRFGEGNVAVDVLRQRKEQADAARHLLVESLQTAYGRLCADKPVPAVVALLQPEQTSHESKQRLEEMMIRDQNQLKYFEQRELQQEEAGRKKRRKNAQRTVANEARLKANREASQLIVQARAQDVADKMAAKRRVLDGIVKKQRAALQTKVASMDAQREDNAVRVKELKEARHAAAVAKGAESEARAKTSKQIVAEHGAARMARMAEVEEVKRSNATSFKERVLLEREAVAERGEFVRQKQAAYRERAEEMQELMYENVMQNLADAEERNEEFQLNLMKEQAARRLVHGRREEHIKTTVAAAQSLTEDRARAIVARNGRLEVKRAARELERAEAIAQQAEDAAVQRQHKRDVVGTQALQSEYAQLIALSTMQQREAQIDAYEHDKADGLRQLAFMRGDLQVQLGIARNKAAVIRTAQERRTASEIYHVNNPTDTFRLPQMYRGVGARIDVGDDRRTPHPSSPVRESLPPRAQSAAE